MITVTMGAKRAGLRNRKSKISEGILDGKGVREGKWKDEKEGGNEVKEG